MSKRQIDGAARLKVFVQQVLNGFEDGQDRSFVVQRAAPPNVPIRDLACKGRHLPGLFGDGSDRDNTQVGQQQLRFQTGSAPLPAIQQAVVRDRFARQRGVTFRKRLAQVLVQPGKFRAGRMLRRRDGLKAQRLCQAFSLSLFDNAYQLGGFDADLLGAQAKGVDEQNGE